MHTSFLWLLRALRSVCRRPRHPVLTSRAAGDAAAMTLVSSARPPQDGGGLSRDECRSLIDVLQKLKESGESRRLSLFTSDVTTRRNQLNVTCTHADLCCEFNCQSLVSQKWCVHYTHSEKMLEYTLECIQFLESCAQPPGYATAYAIPSLSILRLN